MKKPKLKLSGLSGNSFFILGRAKRIARREKWSQEKIECMMKDAKSGDYDHLIQVMMEYFEVE